jgi:hypothetical protein
VARVPADETAFAQREAVFFINLIGVTPWHEEIPLLRERTRQLLQRISPQSLPQTLPNFSNEDDGDVMVRAGAAPAERLAALRRRYDPAGRFVAR